MSGKRRWSKSEGESIDKNPKEIYGKDGAEMK